jgi:hypothetical protein
VKDTKNINPVISVFYAWKTSTLDERGRLLARLRAKFQADLLHSVGHLPKKETPANVVVWRV